MREHEGYGADMEPEQNSPDQQEDSAEIQTFISDWENNDNADLLARVVDKIQAGKNPDDVRKEIRRVDNLLSETMGDEKEETDVLESYLGGGASTEDEDDEWDEAA